RLGRAEGALGFGRRVVAQGDVALARRQRPLVGASEAAAARRRDGDNVAGVDGDVLVLREVRRHVDDAVTDDLDLVDAAGAAALRARRAGTAVVHDHRD